MGLLGVSPLEVPPTQLQAGGQLSMVRRCRSRLRRHLLPLVDAGTAHSESAAVELLALAAGAAGSRGGSFVNSLGGWQGHGSGGC